MTPDRTTLDRDPDATTTSLRHAFPVALRANVARAVFACLLAIGITAPVVAVTGQPFADAAIDYGRAIEWYAPYQSQKTCSPTAKPGTTKLANYLMRTYSGTGSLGIVRACRVGGTSEHKEGRAFDWRVNYYDTTQRAKAEAFLKSVLASDRYGNKHALARRMGLMYVIWNKRIWSAYNASAGWRAYTGASPHRDHVHISLSWAGANGTTSFFTRKVTAPVTPTQPAPKPSPTAPTPAPRPSGPPVLDQSRHPDVALRVPATGSKIKTRFSLKAGRTYRLVAAGTYRYGAGTMAADASCSWHPYDDAGWDRRSTWETVAGGHLDLVVDGASAWRARDPREDGCDSQNVYVWDFRPATTGPVTLQVRDDYYGDNTGRVVVHVLEAGADADRVAVPRRPAPAPEPRAPRTRLTDGPSVLEETVTVPSNVRAGALTAGVLEAGVAYRVEVSGVFDYGEGSADAECTRAGQASSWRRDRTQNPLHVDRDHLDLYVDGNDVLSEPVQDTGDRCNGADHTYGSVYRPDETGRARFRVWDPYISDNTGSLTVRLTRLDGVPEPTRPEDLVTEGTPLTDETVVVDAATGTARTAGTLERDRLYRITVTGTWTTGYGEADAECSTSALWTGWRRAGGVLPGRSWEDLFDVYMGSTDLPLEPTDAPRGTCSPSHSYAVTVRASATGVRELALWDVATRDNTGSLNVRIQAL
ncbi:MAG: hypothetical protein M3Q27_16385 [Actinomycetota bacterium]|nr:hypothetical protein [Actinomycetota bacterium]